MSQIAEALAKAKEQSGFAHPPFGAPSTLAQPAASKAARDAAELAQAQRRQRFWTIVTAITLPISGLAIWSQLRPETSPVQHPAAESVPQKPVAAPANSAPRTPGEPVAALTQAVADMPVGAVLPGEPARIVVAGRVVRAGEFAQGELVFAGIENGRLRFTDTHGAVYTRRY